MFVFGKTGAEGPLLVNFYIYVGTSSVRLPKGPTIGPQGGPKGR